MVAAVSDSSAAEACRVRGAADLATAGPTLILTQSGTRAVGNNTQPSLESALVLCLGKINTQEFLACVKISDR